MESITSEEEASDQQSDRRGSYSPSADVSESESSTDSLTSRRSLAAAPPSSFPPSPLPKEFGARALSIKLDEMEMMKERFAKLLLGEDMSGGGKGVCTALAISNAITNLSATVFGELWRLEPLATPKKLMWRREMDWLLSVSDYIVDLIPSSQALPDGSTYEVMAPRQRFDLYMNLPALRKLDAMLINMLDGFLVTDFWYVDRGVLVAADAEVGNTIAEYPAAASFGRSSLRQEEKWWLPCAQVPQNGLSEDARKRLQQSKDCSNQILKAAMAINSGVLAEMEIPEAYLETLPKNVKSCLGEIIYRYITADQFSPDCLLDCLDISSEHHMLEIANRIEESIHFWRLRNSRHRHQAKLKPTWSGKVKGLVIDIERNQLLAQRAEGLLQSLRLRCPGLPQTDLDMNKIQYNKDVGQSILESYSRVLESLAFNIIARIDDLIFIDDAVKKPSTTQANPLFNPGAGGLPIQRRISPCPFSIQDAPYTPPFSTPYFSSTPVFGSPEGSQTSTAQKITHTRSLSARKDECLCKKPGDVEEMTYTRSLSASKDAGEVCERD